MAGFTIRGLACVRGERLVFTDADAGLAAGEALTLRGPNGSGKSSLLRLMAGLGKPFAGDILWDGRPIREDLEAHHARSHFLGPVNALKGALTARENLRFWARLRGGDDGRVDAALEAFGLGELAELPARVLSTGQARRLALARLMAAEATLWLLDEPTLGLDAQARAGLVTQLQRHLDAGGMAVIATHFELDLRPARDLDLAACAAGAAEPVTW